MSFTPIFQRRPDYLRRIEVYDKKMHGIMTSRIAWDPDHARTWFRAYSVHHTMGGYSKIANAYPIALWVRDELERNPREGEMDFAVRAVSEVNQRVYEECGRRGISFASKIVAIKYPHLVSMFDALAFIGVCACQDLYPQLVQDIEQGRLEPLGKFPRKWIFQAVAAYYRRFLGITYRLRELEQGNIQGLGRLTPSGAVTPLRVIDRCLMQIAKPDLGGK